MVHLVKAMVFPVVMYGCESWPVKKAEHQRIDAFGLWCWRRLLRVPWTARRSNQSILKEISPVISLGGMMLKLKLQYFGHLMQRVDSLEKTLMMGRIGGKRRRGRQDEMAGWHHWLDECEFEWTPGVGDGQGGLVCCNSWGRKGRTQLSDWTELNLLRKPAVLGRQRTNVPKNQLLFADHGWVYLNGNFRSAQVEVRDRLPAE